MSSSGHYTALPSAPAAASSAAAQPAASSSTAAAAAPGAIRRPNARKRKGHRGGKKKRSRRKSFALLHEDSHDELDTDDPEGFYQQPTGNLSGTSIDSEALLDHRYDLSFFITLDAEYN